MKKDISLTICFALLITFSFPPFKMGFLAYIALIPLFLLITRKSIREAFRWGYFSGLLTNLMLLYWIGWATIAGALSAILILPMYLGLFTGLHAFAQRKIGNFAFWLAPVWWTAIEWLKTLSQISFPWFDIGYSQSYYLYLIQYASWLSVLGVSFWVVTINVLVYFLIRQEITLRRKIHYSIVLALLFILPLLHGFRTIPDQLPEGTQNLRVAVVQGNIDPFKKWKPEFKDSSFVTYQRLTEQIARKKPQLIVWPETATPCWLKHEFRYLKGVKDQVDSLGIPLLTGTPDYTFISDSEYRTYNAAIFITPQNLKIQTYYKMQLVPFGERIPYEDSFPFTLINKLLNKLEMGQGNFSPGEKEVIFSFVPIDTAMSGKRNPIDFIKLIKSDSLIKILEAEKQASAKDSVRFAVTICYESAFPQIVRGSTANGAQFQMVITNDAWFGRTSMAFQHLQFAVFRAIENRVSVARAANAGISTFIDPYGRISQLSPLWEEATLVQDIPILNQHTFYVKHGNVFANGILILGLLLLLLLLLKKNHINHNKNYEL